MKNRLALYLLFLIVGCNSKVQKQENIGGLVKIDSIQISIDSELIFQDIDPFSETVLLYNQIDSIEAIYVFDFDGNIQSTFSLTNGTLLTPLSFEGNNTIVAYGSEGISTYSFSGKVEHVIAISGAQSKQLPRSDIGQRLENHKDKWITLSKEILNLSNKDLNKFEHARILASMDQNTGKSDFFLKFPQKSVFRSGKYFFKDAWTPVFTFDEDKLHVVFGIEPVIYTYSASPPFDSLFSLPLHLVNYQFFKGADSFSSGLRFFDNSFTSGKILTIHKFQGNFLIAYYPGFNESNTAQQLLGKSTEEAINYLRDMKKKNPNRMAVVDSLGNRLADFAPEGLVATSMLIRNGDLWMLGSPDLEQGENKLKLFKLALKFEK